MVRESTSIVVNLNSINKGGARYEGEWKNDLQHG